MVEPFAHAVLIVFALTIAGIIHVAWLACSWSKSFAQPLDFGLMFRGRRIFGENKTFRGLVAMPPATAFVFAILGVLHDWLPTWLADEMWNRAPYDLAHLGFWAGFGFMVAELPNSFLKRQLNVAPGATAPGRLRAICFVIDRLDSTVGALIVFTILGSIQASTSFFILALGGGAHWLFSCWLFRLKIKQRMS